MNSLLTNRRILVVEDDFLILSMIEDMLSDLGCRSIAAAATIEQAIRLVNSEGFDAAMLDINLNGRDSFAVADALVARGVPFIFATGNSRNSMVEAYSNRPVLRKPFKFEELAKMLGTILLRINKVYRI